MLLEGRSTPSRARATLKTLMKERVASAGANSLPCAYRATREVFGFKVCCCNLLVSLLVLSSPQPVGPKSQPARIKLLLKRLTLSYINSLLLCD